MGPIRQILTPDQAADYLQINRETVYRYIRQGLLVASKLGRSYRIPKRSLDLLLWATRTQKNVTIRQYTGEETADFIDADQLDGSTRDMADRFLKAVETPRRARGSRIEKTRPK